MDTTTSPPNSSHIPAGTFLNLKTSSIDDPIWQHSAKFVSYGSLKDKFFKHYFGDCRNFFNCLDFVHFLKWQISF